MGIIRIEPDHTNEKKTLYETAVSGLWARLDPGNGVLATQDFRHAVQGDSESVADFVRQL